ncbi:MAG: hypothetical protein KY410_09690, partial [Proteobacteria bacterium]|nr:hypothetical protein [Pseudomonadota bacterium]
MKGISVMALSAFLLLVQGGTALQAATEGSISYRRVYELLYQFRSLPAGTTTHLAFLGRVVNPSGPVPQRLLINHEKEPIVVEVDAFGLFDIPMSPQLAQLNPRMTGEPSAMVLKLGLAIVVRLPEAGPPDLHWLKEGIAQTNAVMRARARIAPDRVPQAHGATLRFAAGSKTVIAVLR